MSPTRARAPGGSFICPYTSVHLESLAYFQGKGHWIQHIEHGVYGCIGEGVWGVWGV